MKTRLKRELHEFLLKERISLETDLVNDFIYKMAGITFTSSDEDRSTPGFSLSSSWDKNEDLKFKLPHLHYPQLLQLLDFFKFPLENYVANSSITLDEKFVFENLLPAFKKYFEEVKLAKPSEIAKYIVKSKPILESSANTTLREYTTKAVGTILAKHATEPSETLEVMLNELASLNYKAEHLDQWPILYKSVIGAAQKIGAFRFYPEVSQNEDLRKQLSLINEGIELFAKYNRCESVLANESFLKEMETFLNGKNITSSLCNIVENTLLSLAEAKLGVNGECHVDKGRDASRLVFAFTDIDKENAAKIVDYLQKTGDDTASEGYGYRRHGSSIPEAAFMMAASFAPMEKSVSRREVIEEHSIETDGKFFHEVVFPKLKAAIEALDKTALDGYRKKSEAYFAKKEVVIESSRFFKPVSPGPVICPSEPEAKHAEEKEESFTIYKV